MSVEKTINFSLTGVSTTQFAIINEPPQINEKLNVTTNFRFGFDKDKKAVGVFTQFTFLNESNIPFLLVEGSCHFQIFEKDWDTLIDNEKKSITLPKGFAAHLFMLCIGTTRGILHTKTENTEYNKFFIPLFNVTKLVETDVVFSFEIPTIAKIDPSII